MDGDLFFGKASEPQGFSTLVTAQWDGNPEPIIREMLQNCLDASVRANRDTSRIWFTIRRVQIEEIPGIKAYRKHFEGALRERAKGKQGEPERIVVQQIKQVLNGSHTRVLFCRDNGIGLDSDGMQRILTEGNTDKEDAGAGVYGIGHLTAFAASDLRFIHYAGRSQSNGDFQDIASAHAVLASRREGPNSGRNAHGYWLLRDDLTLYHRHPYPKKVPSLMESEMQFLLDTGSVVCVIGFNNFRSEEATIEAISRVAAKNFLAAIWNHKMVVHICDEESSSEETVDSESLGSILNRQRNRKQAEQRGGWLSGEQAFRTWQTLTMGRKLHFEEQGVCGYFRLLDSSANPQTRSRVQIFRNGMWITNGADHLLPRDFNGFKPFDAVLEIEGGEVGKLIRGAEGPEHRGLQRKRLDKKDNRKLLKKLRQFADRLKEEAGQVEHFEEFTPPGFAMFRGDTEREAEKVPAYRPRRSLLEAVEEIGGNESTPQPDEEAGGPVDPEHGPNPRPKHPRRFTPKPANSIRGRCSVRAITETNGQISQLRVMWQPPNKLRLTNKNLFVRVRIPSGSDETCEHPISPRWLRISELRQNSEVSRPKDSGFEIELPQKEEPFTIVLSDHVADANAIEVDVVGRRPPKSERKEGRQQ